MGVVISKPMLVGDTTWMSEFGGGDDVFAWENFIRPSSKKGYFLCRSCGADIVHTDNIISTNEKSPGEIVYELTTSKAKVHEKTEKTVKSSFWVGFNSNVVGCPRCKRNIGWKYSRKKDTTEAETDTNKDTKSETDKDTKTETNPDNESETGTDKDAETKKTVKEKDHFFKLEVHKLVYESNYLPCMCGRAVVYIESLFNYSQTGLLINPSVILKQLIQTSRDGKAWIVTFHQAFAKRKKSTETKDNSLPGFELAVLECISCQKHLGWEFVPTSRDPGEKPFVGIIFDNLAITNDNHPEFLGTMFQYPRRNLTLEFPRLEAWHSGRSDIALSYDPPEGYGRMVQHQRRDPVWEFNPFFWHSDDTLEDLEMMLPNLLPWHYRTMSRYPQRNLTLEFPWLQPWHSDNHPEFRGTMSQYPLWNLTLGCPWLQPWDSRYSQEQPEVYEMKRKPRGICLIINNENFAGDANYRRGSTKDAGRLSKVFKSLEFKVLLIKDIKADDMTKALKIIANGDHSSVDCFVCCVLTHGKLDNVSGVDQKLITIKELTENVNASRCKTLAGKPKLFFIQACQGPDHMKGVEIDSSLPEAKTETLPDARATTSEEIGKDSIPDEADFLLAFSTSAGFASYRYPDTGSVYIQILCDFLEKYALNGTLDLVSILEKVNNEVAKKDINGVLKQMPAVVFKLRKKLIFHKTSE